MRISELVAELEVLWAEHGDVEVLREFHTDRYGGETAYEAASRPRFDGADVIL